MLARVWRTVCIEHGLPLGSAVADRTASHLLKLFLNGLTAEDELLDAERNRAKRLRATGQPFQQTALQPMPDCLPQIVTKLLHDNLHS